MARRAAVHCAKGAILDLSADRSIGGLEMMLKHDVHDNRVPRLQVVGQLALEDRQANADEGLGSVVSLPSIGSKDLDCGDKPFSGHACSSTIASTTGHNVLYYHRNQQYSIVAHTNAAGTLVERYTYNAYGTLGVYDPAGTVRSCSTYANRYTYTGREYAPELKLYHFRARWYDPSTGGFISRDPLGYVDGMSLYRGYFGLEMNDPSGACVNCTFWEWTVCVAAITAASTALTTTTVACATCPVVGEGLGIGDIAQCIACAAGIPTSILAVDAAIGSCRKCQRRAVTELEIIKRELENLKKKIEKLAD